MSPDNPIGLCCSRPRVNAVGGIDERAWPYELLLMLGRLKRIPEQREGCGQSDQVRPAADK